MHFRIQFRRRGIKMKKFLATLASLAMMISLTGCGGGGSDNVLKYAIDTDVKSLDSTVATDGGSFTAIHQFTDGLTCRGEDGEIQLALADSLSLEVKFILKERFMCL